MRRKEFLKTYEKISTMHHSPENNTIIYKVKNSVTKNMYALKVLKGVKNSFAGVLFKREVESLYKLNTHENIIKIHDSFIVDELEYGCIVLDYIDGKTLYDKVIYEDISKPNKYGIIHQIIRAIKVAHNLNIIHRDIKPTNIMITDDMRVKLIDFGISKLKDVVNDAPTVRNFASKDYSAPEVTIHSQNATEKSDIYSLGAVIYFLFTGKTPPNPNNFKSIIDSTNGMNPDIKAFISKMVEYEPENRFENLIEVEKVFLEMSKNHMRKEKRYLFAIDSELLNKMRHRGIVPYKTHDNEILQAILPINFFNAYGFLEGTEVDNTNTGELAKYKFIGEDLEITAYYNQMNQIFHVADIFNLAPSYRERHRQTFMTIDGAFEFNKSYRLNLHIKNDNRELYTNLADHKQEYVDKKDVRIEFNNYFDIWKCFLNVMIDHVKSQAICFDYSNWYKQGNYFIFQLKNNLPEDEFEVDKETIFIYEENSEKGGKTKQKIYEIGTYDSIIFDENDNQCIKIKQGTKSLSKQLPKEGTIRVDYQRQISAYRKQQQSISEFEYGNQNNTLKDILLGIEQPSSFQRLREITFFNELLDEPQRRAVKKALCSSVITVIQGPPGTGKTSVIIEIIRQIIKENMESFIQHNNRVLLVSQSHTAVDNILEEFIGKIDGNIKIARIGEDSNLSDEVKESYSIQSGMEKWLDSVINNSNNYMCKMLDIYEVNIDTLKKYLAYLVKIDNVSTSETDSDVTDITSNLAHNAELKRFFDLAQIQQNWVSRIKSAEDAELNYISNSVIIGGTCVGFSSNRTVNSTLFDYVIIDEAAKATTPELLISLLRATKKMILVGDHKQLPPVFDLNVLRGANSPILKVEELKKGLFMRFFDILPEDNKQKLTVQYRMNPIIGQMISKIFYDSEIDDGVSISDRNHGINYYGNKAIVWLSTSKCPNDKKEETRTHNQSFINYLEVKIVKEQLLKIDNYITDKDYKIGIITGYSAQKHYLQKEVKNLNLKSISESIDINTVDAFQGRQTDIIIYSTVRSSTNHSLTLSQFSRHSKHRVIFVFHTNAWNFSSCQFFESQWSGSGIAIQKIAAAAV